MSATHDSTGRVSVSIGIPFLNARPFLADAVRSVFAQTHEDWELILMDDGSTDGSLDVVRLLDDERVRVVSDGTNRGLCARLNQIAALARGKYLARMDADDLMHPERIERQVRLLDENPEIDVVDTATFTVDDDLTPLGIRAEKPLDCAPVSVLERGLLMHPTVMARADWFRRNPYDSVYVRAEDCELWCRTCTTTRFARICEPLLFYREGMQGNLRNYLRGAATMRKVMRTYGPPLVGSWQTSILVARFHARAMMYRVATMLGIQGELIKRRNRLLTASEIQYARETLARILGTEVPGLGGCAKEKLLHLV